MSPIGAETDLEVPGFTDLGNARRLVLDHGQDIRFVHERREWLIWDGKRWALDETAEILRRAKATVFGMYAAAGYESDRDYAKKLAGHATKSESERALRAMVSLAQSEPGIPVTVAQLDADPWLLNVANGTLELRAGQLRPHRREDLITKLVHVNYDAEATCPTWRAFLDRVMDGDSDRIRFIQKLMGYALTGDTREEIIAIAYGVGANGKTTLITAATETLGDYARHTSIETLLSKTGDTEARHDLARLLGARLVVAVEAEAGRRLSESLVKQLTGRDRVIARALYRDSFEFVPTFKLVLATNHRPIIRGTDHAIWRRIRLIPFTVTIPDEQQDQRLSEKLREELPGILTWAVEGCRLWQTEGLGMPAAVRDATAAYREDMDVLGHFIADHCIEGAGERATAGGLYGAYLDWCKTTEEKPVSKRAFGAALAERGARAVRTSKWRGWEGIRLRGPDDPEPESEPW